MIALIRKIFGVIWGLTRLRLLFKRLLRHSSSSQRFSSFLSSQVGSILVDLEEDGGTEQFAARCDSQSLPVGIERLRVS